MSDYRHWTSDEEKYIQDHWQSQTDSEMAAALDRSEGAVRTKRRELRCSPQKTWTPEELQYPEAMKKARSEFFEEAGREMLSTVRRRIGGQGYVANVQDRHVGSGRGYAAVRAKAKTELRGYAAGYVTNALEGGHVQTPGRYVPAMGKKLKANRVKGKYMYRKTAAELPQIAERGAQEIEKKAMAYLEGKG